MGASSSSGHVPVTAVSINHPPTWASANVTLAIGQLEQAGGTEVLLTSGYDTI